MYLFQTAQLLFESKYLRQCVTCQLELVKLQLSKDLVLLHRFVFKKSLQEEKGIAVSKELTKIFERLLDVNVKLLFK